MPENTLLQVPLADPLADNRAITEALNGACSKVIGSGRYILGAEVEAFEQAFAEYVGGAFAIGTASGTDALTLALLALGIGPGDEVILPSHTAGPTAAAARNVGATPVLVDVHNDTFNLDAEAVSQAVGPRVKAAIAVHLYGQPADLEALLSVCRSHGIALVEDCAQAAGAKFDGRSVGTFGDLGCFSFYPTKNLGAIGDAGCVVASSKDLSEQVKRLRTYGWTKPQFAELEFGRCARMDEIQAAMLSVKLPLLDEWNDRRRQIANRYSHAFADLPLKLPVTDDRTQPVYHLYVVRTGPRDQLESFLKARGVQTGRHYPYPVHAQPGLAGSARIPKALAATEQIGLELLSLPLFYGMTETQIEYVIESVHAFYKQ